MGTFDVNLFRKEFPILHRKVNDKPLIYGDNAATSQKPQCVIDAMTHYYQHSNANVHRASHALSSEATTAFEHARLLVQQFVKAQSIQEIIWTKGTTESINLVAHSWGRENLEQGDEILLSHAEHHANIVPWQLVAEQCGATVKVLPLNDAGLIDIEQLDNHLSERTKIVAVHHVSNVIGKLNPIKALVERCHQYGALVLVDGAQSVAHYDIDVKELNCDFYVFSGHKMFGPAGIGVLYGKQHLLESMSPYQAGGEMIKQVSFSGTSFNSLPFKFEAGTPNISGAIGLGQAISFLKSFKASSEYEQQLLNYCYQQLSSIEQINLIVKHKPDVNIFSFTVTGHHNHDVASYMDAQGIAVRSGHHCTMPLMQYLGLSGCIRLSLAAYNTFEEVDRVISCLKQLISGDEQEIRVTQSTNESDHIIEQFSKAKSWDARHREIMLLGKKLPRLSSELKSSNTEISGCESLAWLVYTVNDNGEYQFSADSNAKVIRGLLYIVLAKYQQLTAQQIKDVDIESYFSTLGLQQHLSPSRGNGLKAIVEKIRGIVS